MNREDYLSLKALVDNLGEYVSQSNAREHANRQNTAILNMIYLCAKGLNIQAIIEAPALLKVFTGGLSDAIRTVKDSASPQMKSKLQQCKNNIDELKNEILKSEEDAKQLENESRKRKNLEEKLKEIQRSLNSLKEARDKFDTTLRDLAALGIDVKQASDRNFINNTLDMLNTKQKEYEEKSRAVRDLATKVQVAVASFEQRRDDCSSELIGLLEREVENIKQLADFEVGRVNELKSQLEQKTLDYNTAKESYELATIRIGEVASAISRAIADIKRHKKENDKLYDELRKVGAADMKELYDKINAFETTLQKAIEPYDALLSRIVAMRQQQNDEIVATVVSENKTLPKNEGSN